MFNVNRKNKKHYLNNLHSYKNFHHTKSHCIFSLMWYVSRREERGEEREENRRERRIGERGE
jgi:hypothetical protein